MATALWGADGSVKVAGSAVALVDSWDLTIDVADLEITSLGDSNQMLQSGGGLKKYTGSIKVKHALDDTAGQDVLMANALAGSAVVLSLYESGTTGYFNGTAMLHPAVSMPSGDKATTTYSFNSTGPWTHTG